MKIGTDLRFAIVENNYSLFCLELAIKICRENQNNSYILYTQKGYPLKEKNGKIKKIDIQPGSIKEQFQLRSIFKKDANDIIIFFDYGIPLIFSQKYILSIPSLQKVYYQNFSNHINKYYYLYVLSKSITNAKKIICFDNNTQDELVERFNVIENKISIISGFFPKISHLEKSSTITIDIKSKHSLSRDYFIYSFWAGIEKNIERLILLISNLHTQWHIIDLIILGDKIATNIDARNLVISKKLQKHIHFIGAVSNAEKRNYYNQSIACIFPSLYEPFAFRLNEPLVFNTPIIASNIPNIKKILWDNTLYFSAISVSDMTQKVIDFLGKKQKVNHKEILQKYNSTQSAKDLIDIIKSI